MQVIRLSDSCKMKDCILGRVTVSVVINGKGVLRRQPANPGSPGKMAVKTKCVCVCVTIKIVKILYSTSLRRCYVIDLILISMSNL